MTSRWSCGPFLVDATSKTVRMVSPRAGSMAAQRLYRHLTGLLNNEVASTIISRDVGARLLGFGLPAESRVTYVDGNGYAWHTEAWLRSLMDACGYVGPFKSRPGKGSGLSYKRACRPPRWWCNRVVANRVVLEAAWRLGGAAAVRAAWDDVCRDLESP